MSQLQPPGGMPRPPRMFRSQKILSGEVSLDGYPFRYAAVLSGGTSYDSALDQVLSAVEFLETRGWELVNVASPQAMQFVAVIRRP
ncbi:hypothetical protein ACIA58_15555 [Kribbella sp. NPDC051586]|uniref:hypothetical protein n=1 Tax=Kribbella sp. NPDC051586 TaxID=3364118 RepID=UPI0037908569